MPVVLALAGSCVASIALIFAVQHGGSEHGEHLVRLWNWATVEPSFRVDIVLRADALTAIMLGMVTFISTLVVIYASGYMHGDEGYWRFFAYVALFVFSMTMLVSVSNFVLLYVFWEAVGLCSYLLIGFWFEKPSAAAAGMKAFLVTRVGDFGFALGVFLIWTTFGTLDFHDSKVVTSAAGRARSRDGRLRQSGGRKQSAPGRSKWFTAFSGIGVPPSIPTNQAGRSPPSASCCCSAPAARARSSRCTSGCRTRWKAPRPSAP